MIQFTNSGIFGKAKKSQKSKDIASLLKLSESNKQIKDEKRRSTDQKIDEGNKNEETPANLFGCMFLIEINQIQLILRV